MFATLTVEIEQ